MLKNGRRKNKQNYLCRDFRCQFIKVSSQAQGY
ncbi:hypothetical protein [Hyella patelloides]